eukprot:CAMPEP_0170066486 /NCGR_PEP_ID=MMETSP0019_2-20121128/6168_1 /TAXON_ID=98059 /ORGANISM="Dinobryon sp., Strain UTEXLB2267" /LENGTH=152 /DNA_ID=CAMNT_0010273593 /DNA_START=659 /DNA_END=1117 /DNA_ORIENTATION=-
MSDGSITPTEFPMQCYISSHREIDVKDLNVSNEVDRNETNSINQEQDAKPLPVGGQGDLSTLPSRSHEMYLEINDVTYVFEYVDGWDPYNAANTLALHFCSEKGVMLLNLSSYQEQNPENDPNGSQLIRSKIQDDCVVPIRSALQEKIQSLV